MNKYYTIILITILFLPIKLFAQISISGQIKNLADKPMDMVEVLLQNKDSVVVKSQLTDSVGKFKISVQPSDYILLVKQLGILLHAQNISASQNIDLGVININVNKQQLNEVVVISKKPLIERKVDRLIFNVENSIATIGGDALDALKITPSIRVQNDQIAMIGKSKMSVMVNDKLIQLDGDDLFNYLKTISTSNIKSIEVITTPPAKYDAEGNSGIVNIKLKKAKNDSWNTTLRETAKLATYLSNIAGVNFSYQKNKLELLLDFSGQKGRSIYTNNINYEYPTENWKNRITNTTFSNTINPFIDTNYQTTKKTKIGLQYIGNYNRYKIDEDNSANIYDKKTFFLNSQLKSMGKTYKNINNHSVNFNTISILDTLGKKILTNVDFFTYNIVKKNNFNSEAQSNLLNNISLGITNNENKQRISNFSSRIDFEMPYKFANLTYGANISATKTNNDVETSFNNITATSINLGTNQTNVFEYKENVQALYFDTDKEINSKWGVKTGLRIEFTQTSGFSQTINKTNKINYYKFFPTVYFSYKQNQNNTYIFNFSRRIKRPSYSELNPARWYFNSNSYEVGNPFLQPSFSTNIELSHSYKDIFTTTLYYSKVANAFGQIVIHDIIGNFQRFIRQNYFDATYCGIQEYINFTAFTNCATNISLDITYNESKTYTEYLNPNFSGWGGTFSTTNTILLNKPKTIAVDISYLYNTASKWTESSNTPSSNTNIGIKYLLLNKKMQLALFANDILNTEAFTISSKTGVVNGNYRQFYDSPFIRLSVNYKFGNSTKNIEKKIVGNQDEKDRVKN